ncbi:MAG: hypothetical protein EBX39_11400, partial [Actinobacteria bacterium]|nr:hypothetical protein [Actinomycetota bacterium]
LFLLDKTLSGLVLIDLFGINHFAGGGFHLFDQFIVGIGLQGFLGISSLRHDVVELTQKCFDRDILLVQLLNRNGALASLI